MRALLNYFRFLLMADVVHTEIKLLRELRIIGLNLRDDSLREAILRVRILLRVELLLIVLRSRLLAPKFAHLAIIKASSRINISLLGLVVGHGELAITVDVKIGLRVEV